MTRVYKAKASLSSVLPNLCFVITVLLCENQSVLSEDTCENGGTCENGAEGRRLREMAKLAQDYFKAWNAHDVPALKALFAEDVHLRDWDIEKKGSEDVAQANGAIFEAVPKIKIETLQIHVSPGTRTAVCEILVHLNN